jgi:hypothetical protein
MAMRHLHTEPDTITPGAWIVRNPEHRGHCNIVFPGWRCTCPVFRSACHCEHVALVQEEHGTPVPITGDYLEDELFPG